MVSSDIGGRGCSSFPLILFTTYWRIHRDENMNDVSLQVELGRIAGYSGALSFTLVINGNGSESMQIYAHDPSNMRKSGVLLSLSSAQIEELEEIINKAKTASERFKKSNEIATLKPELLVLELKDKDSDARRLYDLARKKFKDGDRDTTIAILREIVIRHPSTIWATKASKALADAGVQ
jgi:hypothetical protein